MKKVLCIFILLTMIGLIAARYSDQFPLGTYSYLSESWSQDNLDYVSGAMKQLGYNSTIMQTHNPAADLTPIYSTLNSDSIDVVMSDRAWSNTGGNEKYATTGLTTSSYYKFEAEYKDGSSVAGSDMTKSEFWYGSRDEDMPGTTYDINRVGFPFPAVVIPPASNGYVWRCEPNPDPNVLSPGWAYTDLRWRWLNRDNGNIRIGKEFFLKKYSSDPAQDSLYIKFHLRFSIPSSDELPGNTVLLSFSPVGFKYTYNTDGSISGHEGVPTPIEHTNGSQTGNITDLTLDEYFDRFGGRLPTYPFKDIEIRISYQELIDNDLLIDDDDRYKLVNINPRLYYAGHYTLELDYIEIEDKMHRVLMDNSEEYNLGVNSRIADLRPAAPLQNLITAVYTMDEPLQPQFDSFKTIQDMMPTHSYKAMTATHDYTYRNFQMSPTEDKYYDHLDVFRKLAQPRVIMPDLYPIKPNTLTKTLLDWNDPTCTNSYGDNVFIQTVLSKKITDKYRDIKMYYRQNPELNGLMYPVVQAWGRWKDGEWSEFIMPPSETQKMLQYLPLCYGADGIFNFKLIGCMNTPPGFYYDHEYAALNVEYGPGMPYIPDYPITYNALLEANSKVLEYGPKISQMNWINAVTITESSMEPSGISLTPIMVSSIQDVDTNQTGPYGCYVECGMFTDTANNPYLMLVNRRANYFCPSATLHEPRIVPPADYATCFPAFDSQMITIIPDPTAFTRFGTHIGFFDAFNGSVCYASNPIDILPGDGKLLEMCGTLPQEVSENSILSTKAVIEGNVTIQPGINVAINSGTETRIKSNTVINVGDGASFTLRDNVTIEDGVSLIVSQNGSLIFDNANCIWGEASVIEVTGGSLTINGGSMNSSDSLTIWAGIRASFSSLVVINDAIISGAEDHQVISSNLLISNSSFNIPDNSRGLCLGNRSTGYLTEIINTEPGRGFYGHSNSTSKGICLSTMKNPVYISNVDFQNLYYGISKSAIPYATDSVSECNFVNCDTGISLCNNENGTDIQQCSFANNQTGKQGTGIQLVASSPTISTCNFTNLYRGVLTEFALLSGLGIESSVTESNFYNCEMGIESRNSNHRLKANYFNRNNSGIVNHAGSNLNLSYDANNVLMNRNDNIVFYDTMPYESTIQLFTGHNDFYHLTDNSTGISAIDFGFDTNYYNFPITPDFKINASKNWFQDDQVTFNDPAYVDYVYVDIYDPSPSMPAPPPESDRLFLALGYESQGLYELACATYQAIIDDQLEEEKSYVTSAIDGLYRCTKMIPNPAWELTDYFDTKALQYAIDDPTLSAILKDYLAKVFVLNKDFQTAVDLIQLRIDNPISEIDSLRAVLDLEIVLQLAAMEEDKRPLTTKYAQYQYPDIQVFDVMHSNNWDKYNRVLHQNDPDTMSLIAPTPQIQSNYPNPFNPSTTIAFSIPETRRVKISVYNIKGQKVKDLLNTELTRGSHRLVWDGKDTNSRNAGSGIYFFKLESGGKTSIRKAMLMK